ncbi:hypothetical protein FACS189497_15400 [Betaproteobacteria bacterium]|nr:hypothetical protein FACS189497_15400 [Betaproteobacteria bacterium]
MTHDDIQYSSTRVFIHFLYASYTIIKTRAAAAARYALEMNHGWFGAHGFKAGDVVQGVKNLPRGF